MQISRKRFRIEKIEARGTMGARRQGFHGRSRLVLRRYRSFFDRFPRFENDALARREAFA